ncbi:MULTISPECIES: LysE family translocator [Psychrobacter]|uniref:LysE family translocator n=2 Tax=Moraxellaceae TaxID=468 RepID=UPI00086E7D59|nr:MULTISPECIES: LysE family translocator [Psychrobacter]MBA6244708.1 LysE family translocator [Psychrobacter sp. Urea-trap-18]MBA6285815.1 LysE family translocator [Psychrobacter sp. Urea-trap-16]MBA6318713.1 LysE family translocator [Psychrobacter sp. Urea-trap-20]MBA6334900.1 LysE family translocator [Psychrobacter sp. Urea-trap-19]OEH67391.1 MAG: threonine transporter RhtB [Psychrobacter sp. B29-1]|tara:strand:+ start:516 stop:1241 length:726 start_codon:yes stop_codon:yes gene_type:complete
MSWHLFAVFFASTFFISATPGPNMLLAFQYGMNYGVKRTLWTLAGLSLGLFVLLLSTLLGLDVISRQSPWLLTIIKAVGAAYLIYLGISSWRDAGDGSLMSDAKELSAEVAADYAATDGLPTPQPRSLSSAATKIAPSNTTLFRTGVWVSLSNPKAILFFAAFFPKFINFSAPLWPQYVLLTIGLFLSETIWQIVYTLGGKKLASWLDVGNRLAWLNRGCGVIFIIIAAALLAEVINSFIA